MILQLTKQLEDERRLRHEHEMRVDVLERELRATQAKCDYLEAKCDGMSSQVEEMVRLSCFRGHLSH